MPDLPKKPHAPQGSCVVNHSADKMREGPETRARGPTRTDNPPGNPERTHNVGSQQDNAPCGLTTRAVQTNHNHVTLYASRIH